MSAKWPFYDSLLTANGLMILSYWLGVSSFFRFQTELRSELHRTPRPTRGRNKSPNSLLTSR